MPLVMKVVNVLTTSLELPLCFCVFLKGKWTYEGVKDIFEAFDEIKWVS
jgi:hypothetical protein